MGSGHLLLERGGLYGGRSWSALCVGVLRAQVTYGSFSSHFDGDDRSSKSAMHGLIHWISQRYAATGITCNGVAPALIQGTKMLPGHETELAKSMSLDFLMPVKVPNADYQ